MAPIPYASADERADSSVLAFNCPSCSGNLTVGNGEMACPNCRKIFRHGAD